MKLKFSLSLVFLLATWILSAQTFLLPTGFFPGTLHYKNGQVKNALVAAPKHSKQKAIVIKSGVKAKREKIPSTFLDSISITTQKGNAYYFEHLAWATKKGAKIRKDRWLFPVVKGYTTLYLLTDAFFITNEGNAYIVTSGPANGQVFFYLIRKKNEKIALYFGATSSSKGVMRLNIILKKSASLYLSEDKDLVDKIKKKILTHRDMEEIITIYNDYMSQKE